MKRKTPAKKKAKKPVAKKPVAKPAPKPRPPAPPAAQDEPREEPGLRLSPTQLLAIRAMAAQGLSVSDIAYVLNLPADELPDLTAYRDGRISSALTKELEEILELREGRRWPSMEGIEPGTKAAFLAAYVVCGSITQAAGFAQITRDNHYQWLADDAEYKAAFEVAKEQFLDTAEDEAWRRAVRGVVNPKFHQGILVGFEVTHSDGMLQFMLKAGRPKIYRERVSLENPDGSALKATGIVLALAEALTPEQLEALEKKALEAAATQEKTE